MKKRLQLRVTILLWMACTGFFSAQAQTTIIYVDANYPAGLGDGTSWDMAFNNLQDALAAADGVTPTQIWVANGIYYPTGERSGTDRTASFVMKNNLAIYGGFSGGGSGGGYETQLSQRNWAANVTTLSGSIGPTTYPFPDPNMEYNVAGDNSYHVIFSSGLNNTAILDGFTVTDGYADGSSPHDTGAGMYNVSSSPTVANCTFQNNQAANGGGMYNSSSSFPIVTNCKFQLNWATNNGAAIYNSSSSPTVSNCALQINQAANGGGIYNVSSSPTVTDCFFQSNKAVNGAAIYNASSSPTVAGSTFINNGGSVTVNGGGMYNENSSPTVNKCTFSSNTATNGAGGMYNLSSSPVVSNCIFSGNSAATGGGTYTFNDNYGGHSGRYTNCLFNDNTATANGGAVYYDDGNGAGPVYTNCTFAGNTAGDTGNVLRYVKNSSESAPPQFSNSILMSGSGSFMSFNGGNNINNIIFRYNLTNVGSLGTHGSNEGNLFNADARFTNATAGDYTLLSDSPAVNAGSNGLFPGLTGATLDLAGNPRVHYFDNNGIIDMGAYELQFSCSGSNILYVNASASGGNNGSSWENAFTSLQDALNSSCEGITQIWVAAGTYYPVSCLTCYYLERNISFVMRNNLAIYGGFAGGETELSQRNWAANVTILSGEIGAPDNNDNSYNVIRNNGLNNTAILDGFTITGGNANDENVSRHIGGGMYNISSSPTIANCTFSGNLAVYGGGMYNSSSSPNLSNCVFSGNMASFGAGMYNLSSSPVATGCTFSGNTAFTTGGGMFNSSSSPVVSNSTFSGNTANAYGGGMFNGNTSPTISNSIFSGNSASRGGGMANDNSFPVVRYNIFSGNSAQEFGGGTFTDNSGGAHSGTYTNCIFNNNTAGNNGGAAYCASNGNGPVYTNSTFYGNAASTAPQPNLGGNVFHYFKNSNATPPQFNNCILMNTEPGKFMNFGLSSINDIIFQHCLTNVTSLGTHPQTVNGSNITGTDALFTNAAASDYTPLVGSPAIDNGNNNLFPGLNENTLDLGDNPRVFNYNSNGIIDIGAYESQVPTCTGSSVLYVNASVTGGSNSGASWANAYTSLQDALNNECPGITQIWVAAGTYYPTTDNNRNLSFAMRNNLAIYGGFAGGETQLSQRNWKANVTILSGNIGNPETAADNSYSVVRNENNGVDNTAILDGFTITGGNGNYGGGMSNYNTSPTVKNCNFSGNTAVFGGGMANDNSSPVVSNCIFSGNSAANNGGGTFTENQAHNGHSGIYTNCVFNDNIASVWGGAVYFDDGNGPGPVYTNSTFSGNTATYAGNVFYYLKNGSGAPPQFENSILMNAFSGSFMGFNGANINNVIFQHCLTNMASLGNSDNTNLTGTDALFTNAAAGNYTPQPGSPAIDAGSNALFPGLTAATLDLAGNPRVYDYAGGGIIDMGAYEYVYIPLPASLHFDGSNDYVTIPNSVSSAPGFTIEYWMKTTQTGNAGANWYNGNGIVDAEVGGVTNDFGTSLTGSKLAFGVGNPDVTVKSASDVNTGNWVHIAATWRKSDGQMKLYVNGVQEATATGSVNSRNAPANLRIGALQPNINFFTGQVDEVRIWSVARTQAEIQDNMNCSVTAQAGLTAVYNLNNDAVPNHNNSGITQIADTSGNGNNGALHNFALIGITSNFTDDVFEVTISAVPGNNIPQGTAVTFTASVAHAGSDPAYQWQKNGVDIDGENGDVYETSDLANGDKITCVVTPTDCSVTPVTSNTITMHIFTCPEDGIIYVNALASGGNNGSSWENAFTSLQDALNTNCPGQIWVVAGTYKPTTTNDRTVSFVMKNNLAIYGGFAGGETELSQRNWEQNVTILSGNIGLQNNSDNSYHVIFNNNNGLDDTAILDGFTVTGGNANGSSLNDTGKGGGMYNSSSSPTVSNCTFSGNSTANNGGGMYNLSSSPVISNSTFSGNLAAYGGGGMYNSSSSPVVSNCIFSGNSATEGVGGGIFISNEYYDGHSGIYTNCVFNDNTAISGGAVYYDGGSGPGPVYTNSTFSGNTATYLGNVLYYLKDGNDSAPQFSNSILMNTVSGVFMGFNGGNSINNIIFQHCLTNMASLGTNGSNVGNILNADALFTDAAAGDYSLVQCSPAVNTGSNAAYTEAGGDPENDFDLAGNPRVHDYPGGTIDMGAYEYSDDLSGYILYVNASASGGNNGSSWENAFTNLQDALNSSCQGITQIWVAAGTYKPTTTTNRAISFVMRNNLAIYGGFAGGETELSQRNWEQNVTILSGNIGSAGNNDNSYNVIFNNNNGLDDTAILDGFTVTGGNANAGFPHDAGGGMYNASSSPTVSNCTFSGNSASSGGGMFNGDSSPVISNCTFSGNSTSSSGGGGGMLNWVSSPVIINCIFSGNTAANGGGIYSGNNSGHAGIYTNCIFNNNTATANGGAVYYDDGNGPGPAYTNCTFSGNTAASGNVFHYVKDSNGAAPQFSNSILMNTVSGAFMNFNGGNSINNIIFRYNLTNVASLGTNGSNEGNILNTDAQFANAGGGDYSLVQCSPAVNAGSNAAYTEAGGDPENDSDPAGNPRVYDYPGGVIDMGAYEYQDNLSGSVLYVNASASGGNNGFSWENAFTSLQDALNSSCQGITQIWVAAGTYKPTTTNDRAVSFVMRNNLAIYGGFAGGETELSQRNWEQNVTILSGEIGSAGNGDNSYHLIFNDNNGLNGTAVLDGFTITGGNANGNAPHQAGGGMYNNNASPTVSNCIFSGNFANTGGGMYSYASSPTVTNSTFSGNSAIRGGGMENHWSSLTVTNSRFSGNSAIFGGGTFTKNDGYSGHAGIYTNCIFNDNTATDTEWSGAVAGAAYYDDGNGPGPVYTNCTFSGNTVSIAEGTLGNAFYYYKDNNGAAPQFNNCILVNTVSDGFMIAGSASIDEIIFRYCLTNVASLGAHSSTGNNILSTDAQFTNPGAGDYTLQPESPAFNAGSNDLFPGLNENTLDLAGNPRVYDYPDSVIDMGAYELQVACPINNTLYVNASASGGNNGSSWENAFTSLQDALNSNICPGITQIWVAAGTYKPTTTNDRYVFFVMRNNLAIYGGFAGGETELSQRNWEQNVTILSGEIGSAGNDDNSSHVIYNGFNGVNSTAVLDGFTITGGNANGGDGGIYGSGGGMYNFNVSPTISNCTFSGNSAVIGGGMYNGNSSPVISNCTFSGNSATATYHDDGGGGMYNIGSSPTVSNCTFSGNSAEFGGGMYNVYSSPTVTNSTFSGNSAAFGGGININSNNGGNSIYTNCIFNDNTATANGGAVYYNDGNSPGPVYTNSTFSGNTAALGNVFFYVKDSNGSAPQFNNSILMNTASGVFMSFTGANINNIIFRNCLTNEDSLGANGSNIGNILSTDAQFTNADAGDYILLSDSPAVNTGSNDLFPGLNGNTLDLAGNPRVYDYADGGFIDMGAYEYQGIACSSSTTWNGTGWSNGAPDMGKKVVIDGDLVLNTDMEACELKVTESGSLEIPSGFSFTVNGIVVNNAFAEDFVVRSGGNLIQTPDYANNDNQGAITAERESSPIKRLDYTIWSSPVDGQQIQAFSPMTLPNRIYTYEGTSGFVIPDVSSSFEAGKGYMFRAPNNWDPDTPTVFLGKFTGVPFNGDITIATHPGSFTSIGNPYPSNIDAYGLLDENPGAGTLYFWTNTFPADGNGGYTGNNYLTYTKLGGTIGADDLYITTGQGFIVLSAISQMTFTNNIRISNEGQFYKTEEEERHRFWLKFSGDQDNEFNRILIGYMSGATNQEDNQIDGEMFSYDGTKLFSIIDGGEFSVQGRQLPFDASDTVPLGIKIQESGKYKISLSNYDGLFAEGNITIYVKDKLLHIIHNLMESDYEFESVQGEFNDRFEIVYQEEGTMGTDEQNANEIRIYKDKEYIVVDSKTEKILSVELYDLAGRNLYRDAKVNTHHYRVKSAYLGAQVLVVKAQSENGEIVTKKIINK